ncbi:MAG: nitroreductase family protein [Treponema sp.]|nr:nitroreductase family protein [Treponema sp.]
MTDNQKTVLNAIFSRRSIRRYISDKPVEKEKIAVLLETAMAAPSACNLQPWEFIIVSDKNMLLQLSDSMQSKINAPLAMVICANTSNIPWEGQGWRIDLSAAVQNMLIAAEAMDLGSLWIGSHDEEKIRALFNIPKHICLMSVVYFGYPDEKKPAGTRYTEEAVYFEKYDPSRKRQMRTMEMLSDLSVKPAESLK